MLTTDQVAILLLGWVFAIGIVCMFLAAADAPPRRARHVVGQRPDPADGPPTQPILLGEGAGVPDTIKLPQPRRYSDTIPVLVVDGPPSGRGQRPIDPDNFPVPVVRVPSCQLCRDGEVVVSRDGICPWCRHGRQ